MTALCWVGLALPAQAAEFDFWVQELRQEAAKRGISATTFDAALKGVRPNPRVLELDRSQPEFTLTFQEYLDRVVTPKRIETGREMLAKHRDLLREIGQKYGVQPRFILALWGIESDYGRKTGGFPVIEALATLAYDGRRSSFFRKELLAALHILEEKHVTPGAMLGSWAGAMGQCQFMPTSFRAYAVDYDGDGRRDIWTSKADVFASIANYLANYKWRGNQTWGRPVRLPADFDHAVADGKVEKPLEDWQRLGVRRTDGRDLPAAEMSGAIVLPSGADGPAYLVYHNYNAILYWNRSTYFAMAVGHLADQIAAE